MMLEISNCKIKYGGGKCVLKVKFSFAHHVLNSDFWLCSNLLIRDINGNISKERCIVDFTLPFYNFDILEAGKVYKFILNDSSIFADEINAEFKGIIRVHHSGDIFEGYEDYKHLSISQAFRV